MTYMIKGFYNFLYDIWKNKKMLLSLAKNDFKSKFSASLLGILWAFVQPLVTLLVMWFVFEKGLRNAPVANVAFIVWFTPAYLVWSFFADSLISVTGSLFEYSYLVKKINFRISIIPLIKILSSCFVHLFFILFIVLLCNIYGIKVSIYNFQVVYYFFSTVVLLTGLGWALSAMSVFIPDIGNIISVFIQIGFWATPLVWTTDNMSASVQFVLKLNPMFYICRGYRDCFIDNVWFWERGALTLYFWIVAVILFVLGAMIFKRLRPHLADVL